jgi:release factor glutamine methyltransferase
MAMAPTGSRTVAEAIAAAASRLAAAGVEDARLEAELLLAHAAGLDRSRLIARLAEWPDDAAEAAFATALERRERREPLAYITGWREFYGLAIRCSPPALIPRPESELLVEVTLDAVRARKGRARVADVGTGGGAIAVAIAASAPRARVVAIERSQDALALARENVRAHRLEGRIELRTGDLLDGAGRFDAIVANLPYLADGDVEALQPEVRDFEPRRALVAGPRGTEVNLRLIAQAATHLARRGVLALEMAPHQAAVLGAAARASFLAASLSVIKDLAGHDRVLVVQTGGGAAWRTTS